MRRNSNTQVMDLVFALDELLKDGHRVTGVLSWRGNRYELDATRTQRVVATYGGAKLVCADGTQISIARVRHFDLVDGDLFVVPDGEVKVRLHATA